MKILAIESSCDETAAAVIEDGRKILSSVVDTQIATHALYGGGVPEIASRRHMEAGVRVTEQARKDAEMDKHDVDAVAATCAPGLIGALLVGANFGKSLAFAMNKPFIPVHHIRGHIAATYLAYPELKPPFLSLIASGGHSEIVMVKSYTEFEILGGTRDDAAGEAFDKVARVLGVGYPGGPKIDKLAQDGDAKMYKLPDSHIKDAPLDFSFSGLKTAVINLAHNAEQKGETIDRNGLAAPFCAAGVHTLVPRLEMAVKQTHARRVVCAGGVAANSFLRAALQDMATREHVQLFMPPLHLCGDNAAMIGSQAYYEYQAGTRGKTLQNAYATADIGKNICDLDELRIHFVCIAKPRPCRLTKPGLLGYNIPKRTLFSSQTLAP